MRSSLVAAVAPFQIILSWHAFSHLRRPPLPQTASRFFAEHHLEHLQYHRREIQELSCVRTLEKMEGSEIVRHFRCASLPGHTARRPSCRLQRPPCPRVPIPSTSKYHLKLCEYSFQLLFSFVLEHRYNILQRILNQRLKIESAFWTSARRGLTFNAQRFFFVFLTYNAFD